MFRRNLLLSGVLIVILAIAVGCGGDDDDDTSPTATPSTGAPTATTGAATQPSGGGGDPAAGQAIAQANCFTCHSIDGSTIVGPTWKGLYGRDVELESGETVTADDDYIRESILDPNAKIVKGFPAAMPTFSGILNDQQIADVIAYIKTLE